MRNSPVLTVDASEMPVDTRKCVQDSVENARQSGKLDLTALPEGVREQILFALDSIAKGRLVAAVANGKPLTTTEAAKLLGMSRTHLTRLCTEGRIPSFRVGSSLRVDAETVTAILQERSRARLEAENAVKSAETRRRARAARAAGLE